MLIGKNPQIKQGYPVVYVAASDATAREKSAAAYVAKGSADEVQIEAALAALPSTGGIVELSSGTFSISSTINITSDGVVLRGAGALATIISSGAGGAAAIDVGTSSASRQFVIIENLRVSKAGTARESGSIGIHYHRGQTTMIRDVLVGTFETGIDLDSQTGSYSGFVQPVLDNVRISQCLVGLAFSAAGGGGSDLTNAAQVRSLHIVGPGFGVTGSFGIKQDDNCGQGNWFESVSIESVETGIQAGGNGQWWNYRMESFSTEFSETAAADNNVRHRMSYSPSYLEPSVHMDDQVVRVGNLVIGTDTAGAVADIAASGAISAFRVKQTGSGAGVYINSVGTGNRLVVTGDSGATFDIRVNSSGHVFMGNLPTANPAVAGQVWNNAGTLALSSG